jgi:hypothetical protein
MCHG